jgi:transposase InsO family protein
MLDKLHLAFAQFRPRQYDGNALVETLNGLHKAEVIHRQSLKSPEAVKLATLTWLDCFNHRRLLEPIGNIPPAEAEAIYYRQQVALPMAA